MMRRLARGLAILVAIAVLGSVVFTIWAWRGAIDPITPPVASSFDAALVAKGEKLADAGFCLTCHTPPKGKPYAGGLSIVTAFGTIYSTNITPDPATGIGSWSQEAFARALHEGVARDGSHLFPAFPYDHFTKVSDDDAKALYAFMMTRPPVAQTTPPNTVPFPLNVRLLQAGWKLLYFKEGRYQAVAEQSAEWNRGAYLAEGLSHCGACHTPRGPLGAEKKGADAHLAGAAIDGWFAPALSAANPAPVPWSAMELHDYLRNGGTPYHGVAAGPMSNVVHQGYALLEDADVNAVAAYIASGNGSADRKADVGQIVGDAISKSRYVPSLAGDHGARLYTAACAGCHYNPVSGPQLARPELGLKSSISAADPTNLVQVILHGISVKDGLPGRMMPAFGAGMSDADVAAIATYLRQSRTTLPPWTDVPAVVARVRSGKTT
jgi:mono/diheme cytochrome c family protein